MSIEAVGTAGLTLLGLCAFEIVSSIDNAVINAEVLATMSQRARRWFLFWGILFAVFVVRGGLPWLIVWIASPGLGPFEALTASLSGDPATTRMIHVAAPILLAGGGVFLLFLFCHWIFLDNRDFGLRPERFMHRQGPWFYAVVSVFLSSLVWFAIHRDIHMAFGAVMGSTVFFITHGFKQNAERAEQQLLGGELHLSDLAKLFYLEVIDASFSMDGVLGAFAFTMSVPLILAGNGLGAIVLRQLTVSNIERVKRYRYLKHGAMYSVGLLGAIMIAEAFGAHLPSWLTPVATLCIIGYFVWRSVRSPGLR